MSKLQLDRRDFLQTMSRAAGAMVFAGPAMLLAPSRLREPKPTPTR